MHTAQSCWTRETGWEAPLPRDFQEAQLALVFGARRLLPDPVRMEEIQRAFPRAQVIGCSTAGEILGEQVRDDSLTVTAVHLEHSHVVARSLHLPSADRSAEIGEALAAALPQEDLVHVFVLSDGLGVNGSALVEGLARLLPRSVSLTGGLSGDGDRFQQTWVLADGEPRSNHVSVVGLYGSRLRVGCASLGGWDSFGPERVITRSRGNVLYELDGRSALALYKEYLGPHAQGLPATGLLFPLAVRASSDRTPVVRTILSVDESEQSLTFAGDVPEGTYARLMRANFDRLVDGAAGAARTSRQALAESRPELALLISCVGRKIVLKQRVEEEVEAVRSILGPGAALAGFYSYGEISPFHPEARCELHNQTMTVTTFSEAA